MASNSLDSELHLSMRYPGDDHWHVSLQKFAILNELLQSKSNLSTLNAAQQIIGLHPSHRIQKGLREGEEIEEPASFFLELWDVMLGVADQIPPRNSLMQDRLVELLQELRGLPEVKMEAYLETQSRADLPHFGMSLVEEWNSK